MTVHVEVLPHLQSHAQRDQGSSACRAGVALNPSTPVPSARGSRRTTSTIVLVMSVNPGFGGQSFIPHSESKIQRGPPAAGRAPAAARDLSKWTAASTARHVAAGRARRRDHAGGGRGDFRHTRSGAGDARSAGRWRSRPRGLSRDRDVARASHRRHDRARALCGNGPDGRGVPRQLLRLVRGRPDRSAASARLDLSRDGSTRAFSCPSSRRTATYLRPARYDDEIEIRTAGRLVSRGPGGVRLRGRSHERRRRHGDRADVHAAVTPDGRPCRLPAASEGTVSHEGAGHRRRRVHRLAPGRDAARHAAPTVIGIGLLHGLLPAADQGSATSRTVAAHDRFRFVETSIQDADLDALLDGVTHVFHLAAQAGVRKSWGRDFQIYTDQQRRRDADPAGVGRRAADREARLRLELVGLRRRRADPDARGGAAAARCRRTA